MISKEPSSAAAGGAPDGQIREIDAATVRGWHEAQQCVLIDVREEAEFCAERIRDAVLAPLSRLESVPLAIPAGKKTVFLCRSGNRTRVHAARLVRSAGGDAYALAGGMIAWKACGFPVERD